MFILIQDKITSQKISIYSQSNGIMKKKLLNLFDTTARKFQKY